MKTYIGNKTICLAIPEDNDSQAGYTVLYPDGSETWLVKEIFDFEFRVLTDDEFDLMISIRVEEDKDDSDLLAEYNGPEDPHMNIDLGEIDITDADMEPMSNVEVTQEDNGE